MLKYDKMNTDGPSSGSEASLGFHPAACHLQTYLVLLENSEMDIYFFWAETHLEISWLIIPKFKLF